MKYNTPDNKLIYESIFDRQGHSNVKKQSDPDTIFKVVQATRSRGEFYIYDVYQEKGINRKSIVSKLIQRELSEDPDVNNTNLTSSEIMEELKQHFIVSKDFKNLAIHEEGEFYILHPNDFGYNDIVNFIGYDEDTKKVQEFMKAHDADEWYEHNIYDDEGTLMDLINMNNEV